MILIKKELDDVGEWDPILIVGTYSEEQNILSYKLDILKKFDQQDVVNISIKTFKKFEKYSNEAVSYLAQLYVNQFFIVGYSSGTISIFSCENSSPLNIAKSVFDQAVSNIYVVEEGKFFISSSNEKMRFHSINMLTHSRIEQEISTFYLGKFFLKKYEIFNCKKKKEQII